MRRIKTKTLSHAAHDCDLFSGLLSNALKTTIPFSFLWQQNYLKNIVLYLLRRIKACGAAGQCVVPLSTFSQNVPQKPVSLGGCTAASLLGCSPRIEPRNGPSPVNVRRSQTTRRHPLLPDHGPEGDVVTGYDN